MGNRTMHIHLDPVGGIAGDMFVGAVLDIHPELAEAAIAAVRAAGIDDGVKLAHIPFSDEILSGSRFEVKVPATGLEHHHVRWSALNKRLSESRLAPPVRARAIDIFTHLAEAEARVHGKAVATVAFHEVGAWDSIADIVAAAFVIESLDPCDWSIGAIPIGSGRVSSEHGLLPVPAPATVLLLEGFNCFDDGFPGERVTPTGAAIIKHLDPAYGLGPTPRQLKNTGYGFGTRRIAGLSNCLRVLQFGTVASSTVRPDQAMVIRFEVDDQTAEDLAVGLERLRGLDGVLDVNQIPITGKQGRLLMGIQVLARPEMIDSVTDACFRETTTLGLRLQLIDRLVLARREAKSAAGVTVKVAERPGGPTAKADMLDIAGGNGHRGRQARRDEAESEVLTGDRDER
jgi:uncharacterized protein (TIGR00299 family) protein